MGKSGFLHWPSKVRPWPSDFPQVVTHISLQRLQSTARGAGEELDEAGKSMAYRYAKAGDAEAARRVVEDVLKPELVLMLNRQFPEAIVASIHAEESTGVNKLSVMYARALGDIGDFELEDSIVQTNRAQHTGATARQRLARRVEFAGSVLSGRQYLIVDDVVTSGSSLAALRHFIESLGGLVVAASTLAAAPARHGQNPIQLAITQQTAREIGEKFLAEDVDAILRASNKMNL